MKTKSLTQVLLGVVVAGLGVGFLLDTTNILDFSAFIGAWWPLLVIFAGVLSLSSNPKLFGWPLLVVLAGVLLQLRQLNLVDFNIWSIIWPLALIVLGLSFIFEIFTPKPKATTEKRVSLFAAFSGLNKRYASKDFEGGTATALFGGIELDFTEASIAKDATLEVFTAFGGIDIRVPDTWNVEVTGLPLFGGWEDKTKKPSDPHAPTLKIRGTCLFGGTEIKN
jgi:hypothetical protein